MKSLICIALILAATPTFAVIDPMAANQWNRVSDMTPLGSGEIKPFRASQKDTGAGSFSVTFSRPSSVIAQKIGIDGRHLGLLAPIVFPELKRDKTATSPVIGMRAQLPHDITAATINEPATGLIMGLILFLLILCFRHRRSQGPRREVPLARGPRMLGRHEIKQRLPHGPLAMLAATLQPEKKEGLRMNLDSAIGCWRFAVGFSKSTDCTSIEGSSSK